MPSGASHWFREISHAYCVLASLWCLLPSLFAAFISFGTIVESWPTNRQPVIMSAAWLKALLTVAVVIGFAGLIVSMLNCICQIRLPQSTRATWQRLIIAYLNVIAVFTLPAVRLFLPFEDPYTGMGSPMASALGFVMLTIGCCVFVLPVAVSLVVATHVREDGQGPATNLTP
jgi:hypothetical protein